MSKSNYYETLYLTRPDLTGDELGKVQGRLKESIAGHEGEIYKSDKWAERDLAYRINNYSKGVYYILVYRALPSVVAEIEKNLKFLNTDVLRFMTVKIDEASALKHKSVSETQADQGGI
jgi:small subunit ribosomal protein S6